MHFRQSIPSIAALDSTQWALTITGIHDGSIVHPAILSLDDLADFPTLDMTCPILCAHASAHPHEAPLFYTARWHGIALRDVLETVEVRPSAAYANLFAADGYSTFITLDQLRSAVLVRHMDGQPLTLEQGYPARLIVPGLYGYKMPKSITRIELSAHPTAGFWEQRGWDASGDVSGIRAAITSPTHGETLSGTITISGRAIAPNAPGMFDLRIDGQTHTTIIMYFDLNPLRAADWSYQWMPPHPGDFLIEVVASPSRRTLHTIRVHVR